VLLIELSVVACQCSGPLNDTPDRWPAFLITHRFALLRLGIGMAAATVIFGGRSLLDALQQVAERGPARGRSGGWAMIHLLAFGAVVGLSTDAMNLGSSEVFAGIRSVLWFATALTALISWAMACLPMRSWLQLLWQGRRAFSLGAVVGILAWA